MISEDYCSYEIAKLLKEKGLDTKFVFFYRTDEEGKYIHHANTLQPISYKIADDEVIAAITHQMAMKWLRERHNLHIEVIYNLYYEEYKGCMYKAIGEYNYTEFYSTYEEAVETALKHCLTKLI